MYTMVLMAAMTGSPDVSDFGGRRGGCNGAASCHGVVVASGCTGAGYAGCTGAAFAGCTGSGYGSCYGSSCHGSDRGGFLGLRNRGNGCDGGRGGFLGLRNRGNGCDGGSSSCHGSGYGSCYGSGYGSCYGSGYGASCHGAGYMMMPGTTGCTGTIVGGTPPVLMPKPETPKTGETPKIADPKK